MNFKRLDKAKKFYVKYEHRITPVAFFVGFMWDNLTLRRIDLLYENFVLLWDLFVVGLSIVVIHAYEAGYLRGKERVNEARPISVGGRIAQKLVPFVPILMQFAFGGLFSAFLVFYSRSSSVLASWPFLLFLLMLFVGNELFRKRYAKLTFQISFFFIALFSYAVFALPILIGKMGPGVFLLSGALSLLVIALFTFALFRIVPSKMRQNRRALLLTIGGMYGMFHILYFANIIPPIPLSIKESGIYHSVERIGDERYIYKVSFEPAPWYLFSQDSSGTFHWTEGERIYSYSAVFAPTKIDTIIFHRWSRFDEVKDDWVETSYLRFPIAGGRAGGYRGYTYKNNIQPGKWRVDVITERGQILGRRTFKVVEASSPPELKTGFR